MNINNTFSNYEYQKNNKKVTILNKTWDLPIGVFASEYGIFNVGDTQLNTDIEKEISEQIRKYNRLQHLISLKNRID